MKTNFLSGLRSRKTTNQLVLLKADTKYRIWVPTESRKSEMIKLAKAKNLYFEGMESRIIFSNVLSGYNPNHVILDDPEHLESETTES